MLRRPWVRRLVLAAFAVMIFVALMLAGCVWWVERGAWGHIYSADDVPPAPVALVLGAGLEADGTPNGFLAARLDLAQRLYQHGKVKVLLVSGDNSRPDYDEPNAMRTYLVKHGIPHSRVVLDYAGFDTYDSCARANRIFGVRRLTVVTQSYHIDRAVALCRHLGIDATGVGDDTVRGQWDPWWHSTAREHLACVKAVYDMATGRNPVFLGRHETGVDDALRASP